MVKHQWSSDVRKNSEGSIQCVQSTVEFKSVQLEERRSRSGVGVTQLNVKYPGHISPEVFCHFDQETMYQRVVAKM